ncbi:hypothetical protein ILUMI_05260 [Ignelater luminosus]|uniref:C2H2-type domain-containing protein n=1 Tax=Ignelater luminosus TaxID=2038154 RepID=A0A8K0DBC7_IGNLU|nr:hypothetical protein ILUMI_05260 [Ignelater luminosus]
MTMDITSRRGENIKTEVQRSSSEEQISAPKTVKRPFDVAFLMLPDDKLKHKQAKSVNVVNLPENTNNNIEKIEDDDDSQEFPNSYNSPKTVEKMKNHARYIQNALNKHQVFGDPKINHQENTDLFIHSKPNHLHSEQKSAFTKVNLISKESRASPSLSASPDVNYQNSLSPSPPIINRNYHPNMLSPNQIFKTQSIPAYQNTFIQENLNNFTTPAPISLENPFLAKNHPATELLQPSFPKMRPMLGQYRHELSYNYSQFPPPPEMLKMAQPDLKFPPEIRNPAAAILSTLLPPSLAALSLPAQNICAKCNISFRMTSDLVYHMRSHHKNDALDATKKRREEKLKCPVCAESFRERHHLTRHMTAHQDKDEDEEEPASKKKEFEKVERIDVVWYWCYLMIVKVVTSAIGKEPTIRIDSLSCLTSVINSENGRMVVLDDPNSATREDCYQIDSSAESLGEQSSEDRRRKKDGS